MTPRAVEVQRREGLRWLYLNRPERRNAIDEELVGELAEAVADADGDATVQALIIAGRGASFCAGADLRHLLELETRGEGPLGFLTRVSALVTQIERCSKPVVAAVHGHVVAGGLEMALACDAVVAAHGTLIGDGHLRNRLLPAGGSSVRLPRKVGHALARRLLLSGELLPAEDLAMTGWLDGVVSRGELEAEATALARRFTAVAGPAQRNMKALLVELEELGPAEGLQAELRAFDANWHDADAPRALRAFLGARAGSGAARDA
jgi:enoyl-CoA hydratase